MSTIKTKFTLHENHKDFALGVSKIDPETLIPYSAQGSSLMGTVTLMGFIGFMCMVSIFMLVNSASLLLFQHFSQEAAAHVTACKMTTTEAYGYTPELTYTYPWNGETLSASQPIYGYGLNGDCSYYLSQPLAIRVLVSDPTQTRSVIADSSRPLTEKLFMLFGACLIASMCFGGLYYFSSMIVLRQHARRSYPRLTQHGLVLEGKILSIHGYGNNSYIVDITYGFETPRKKYLTGRAEAQRNDLKSSLLPPIGSPITILYADDHAHMML